MNESFEISMMPCGALTAHSKRIFAEVFRKMGEGFYSVHIKKQRGTRSSRYKYYWSHLMMYAVNEFNRRGIYQVMNEDTGEVYPLTTDELHEMMKHYFNPVITKYKGMKIIKGGKTRKLDDSDFINEYEEKVVQFLVENDVIPLTRDEWNEQRSNRLTSAQIVENLSFQNQNSLN
jgi:hypothetical protein